MGWSVQSYRALVTEAVDVLILLSVLLLLFVVLPSLLSAVASRNSLLLRWLDIAIVTVDGRPASRWRVLGRNVALWLLVAIAIAIMMCTAYFGRPRVVTIFVVVGMIRLFTAERGLHDEIAGTFTVPR